MDGLVPRASLAMRKALDTEHLKGALLLAMIAC